MLTITAAKGGVGKTTSAVNLAAALVALGHAVELRDLDPQASATLALGQEPTADPWAAPALPLELDGLSAVGFWLRTGGRALALGGRDQAARHVAGGDSLTVLDCGPGLSPLTLAAIEAADVVLVPLEGSPLSLPGLADIAAVVASLPHPPRLRAVLVRVNDRRILTGDVRERIRHDYAGALYGPEVPEDVRVAEAPSYGLPVMLYAPSSRGALAYRALAKAVARDLHV